MTRILSPLRLLTLALALPLSLTALCPVQAQSNASVVTYTYTGGIPKDVAKVQDAMNAILNRKKAGVQVKLQPTDWGEFDQKVRLAFAAGEKCDVIFTAPWINNYFQNVSQGNLLPLDDLLAKYAPKLYKSMPQTTWDAARINGKIYGVLNQQIFARTYGFTFRKDLSDKYQLNLAIIKKYEDLEPFLARVKAGEGASFFPLDVSSYVWNAEYNGFDPIVDDIGVLIKSDDKNLKVVAGIETPEFQKAVNLQYKWAKLGYYNAQPDADYTANFKAGKRLGKINLVVKPTGDFEFKNQFGFTSISKSLTKAVLTTNGVIATMNGVCRTSSNPQAAVKFLEQLNTDPELYNTLAKGVEGVHWTWLDKAKKVIGPASGAANYNPNTDWMFGNTFNSYYSDPSIVGTNGSTKRINQRAAPSNALGFTFDSSKVKSEVARVQAAYKEVVQPIIYGQVDPKTALPAAIQTVRAAGMDAIVAEAQRQLAEWKKTGK